MAHKTEDRIDFNKLEEEAYSAIEADQKYWRENDAKFRAVDQRVATYEEFRDIVRASHLKPLEKKDKVNDHFVQPWNNYINSASLQVKTSNEIQLQQGREVKKLPVNGLEFTRSWRYCKTPSDKYSLLQKIGPDNLEKLFKSEISFGLLGELIDVMLAFVADDAEEVLKLLESLTHAGRFSLSLQFLTTKEKENIVQLFNKLELLLHSKSDCSKTLMLLKKSFGIKEQI